MLSIGFKPIHKILCLGAHVDDIEIGCGGTVLKLLHQHRDVEVSWVVFSAAGARKREARRSARILLKGERAGKILLKSFPDSFFPFHGADVKAFFEELKFKVNPDLIFTHYREDRHQDHRLLSDLTWNTFRDHLILEYEIPKYDGDLGNPNFYVPLDGHICQQKVKHLCAHFQTQANKHWFSADTFLALMRLRGVECASRTKYAEAFYCRKIVL